MANDSDFSMVERVARAIKEVHQGDAPLRVAEFPGIASYYSDMARAAIAAMREPTEAMLVAGDDWLTNADCRTEASAVWRSMLDSALSS